MSMTVAQVLARTWRHAGVQLAAGIPGSDNLAVIEAIRQEGIRLLLTHDEGAAGILAATHGQIRGGVDLAFATLGPGGMRLVYGLGTATMDRRPLIGVAAQREGWGPSAEARPSQRVDLRALFAPVSKGSWDVRPGNAARVAAESVRLALAPRPGATALVVASDAARLTARETAAKPHPAETARSLSAGALRAFRHSRRCVIVAGGDIPPADSALLAELAEALSSPTILTPQATGWLPEGHPWLAGRASGVHSEPFKLLREADLVLALGVDAAELYGPWPKVPTLALDAIEADPALLIRGLRPIRASWPAIWEGLLAAGRERRPDSTWGRRMVARTLTRHLAATQPDDYFSPLSLSGGITRALPGCRLVCDTGYFQAAAVERFPTQRPLQLVAGYSLSGMGFALPAAIGAALADPTAQTVALMGDGSLAMVEGEIETAARAGVSLAMVVALDGELALIRVGFEQRGYGEVAVRFTPPDIEKLAAAHHIRGRVVESEAGLVQALRHAAGAGGVHLIGAVVRPSQKPAFD